jgi:hypothetical protein
LKVEAIRELPPVRQLAIKRSSISLGDTTTLRSGITGVKPKQDYAVIGTFAPCARNELAV